MFRDIFAAFAQQFPRWRERRMIIALLVLMAILPVGELLVLQVFSNLLVEASQSLAGQLGTVVLLLSLFLAGFAVTRGLQHGTKFWRVRIFRAAFADLQDRTGAGAANWQWARAFGVSSIIADLMQIVAVLGVLFYFDLVIGGVSAVLTVVVIIPLSLLYRRQLRVQLELMDAPVKRVEAPIRERIYSGEFAAIAASAGSGIALALVVLRIFSGGLDVATAIVLAMALRIYFGRIAALSPTFMRFARDSLRHQRDVERYLARNGGAPDPAADGDFDSDTDADPDAVAASVRDEKAESRRRSALVGRILLEAQRGESARFHRAASQLWSNGDVTVPERNAMRGAEAFLAYATATSAEAVADDPVPLFWWSKPFPGSFDEWLNPYLLGASTGRAVRFAAATGAQEVPPHLMMGGSLASHAQSRSILVGTGVSKLEATVEPTAEFISLRGPLTHRVVRRNGGSVTDSFGDPRLLLRRVHPLTLGGNNGRLAFVRNHSDAGVPYVLAENMDEISITGSAPEQVVGLVDRLATYRGVVTTSLGVLVVCQSYGIPSALACEDESRRIKRMDMELRDHLLGSGAEGDWELHKVPLDLGRVPWSLRLVGERIADTKLDEISAALEFGLSRQAEAVADALERELADQELPGDG
ncbi:hypothetical protein Q9S78_13735 [Microbacterium sp. KSW-18]|uniref:ABC transmembrane type-1 domain-containing protein n=1 Tax=Microbacterium aquilitoris TaxID=3067307 RepID=A0ABU3GLZ6_9MICO|nr:hypothetical protein [Microbacterium sp. KSW-18]MDT3331727.1 hypothetical protein [Microbacterium sp. KSW-18]